MNNWILLPVFLPILSGAVLLWCSFRSHLQLEGGKDQWKDLNEEEKKKLHTFVGAVLLITAALALAAAWSGERESILFYLMKDIPIYFHIDAVGRLFVTFVSVVWVAVGFYSFGYMKHEGEERRFFGFYLVVYGVLIALDFAGNLVTMYFFYEFRNAGPDRVHQDRDHRRAHHDQPQ